MKTLCTLSKCFCIAAILLFAPGLSFHARAQIINTIIGTGIPGYTGDGGPAVTANINDPVAISIDGAGNIYIADWGNNCVRKINSAGVITTVAGTGTPGHSGDGGPATLAELIEPSYVLADGSGNIYISENGHYIRKINAAGSISTIAGNGIPAFGGDGGPATAAMLDIPYGMVLDTAGNLYVADRSNHRVRKISTSGIITTVAGNGTRGFSGDGVQATAAELAQPNYLAMDGSGILYISDNGNQRIRKVDAAGIITTVVGTGTLGDYGDGGPATAAELSWPAGMKFDAAGNFYLADAYNYKVRKVNMSGIITTIVGTGVMGYTGDGGPATAAQLNAAFDIVFNASGDLLVVDYGNNVVREINVGNHPPAFTGGNTQDLAICTVEVPTPINSLLAIIDTDTGQTETWSLTTPPAHGMVVAGYTTVSTGSVLTPTGLSYTAAGGYTGSDMFMVSVTDGIATTVVTVNVTVYPLPDAGVISGIDSVCPGQSVTLSETVSDGIWSTSSGTISVMDHSGTATGLLPGNDTIIYTIVSPCGIVSAIFPFKVGSYDACHTAVSAIAGQGTGITTYPNPNYGTFTVNLLSDFDEEVQFTITNMVGQKIKDFIATTNKQTEIKLDSPPGMYFLSAITGHVRFVEKIIVDK